MQAEYCHRRIARVFIASVFMAVEPSIRILDHAINQFIYLRHDKATERRKVAFRKFYWEAALEEADKD